MKPTPRILKALDPQDLGNQVSAALEAQEDLHASPFVSHEGLLCQRVISSMCVYEYSLIVAEDLDELEQKEQILNAQGYDLVFDTILWQGRYLQWMHRFNTAGIPVRDAVVKLSAERAADIYAQADRASELALVEGVRKYMGIKPLADDRSIVTLPFPVA